MSSSCDLVIRNFTNLTVNPHILSLYLHHFNCIKSCETPDMVNESIIMFDSTNLMIEIEALKQNGSQISLWNVSTQDEFLNCF